MARFDIEVYADTNCPFSFLGKRYLDQAIETWRASHPDDEFTQVWKPFYVFPQAKVSAYDVTQLHNSRMGGDTARMARFYDRVERAGDDLGIAFRWGGRTGSTRASHRLIRLARERDRAAAEAAALAPPAPLPWAAKAAGLPTPPDSQQEPADSEQMGVGAVGEGMSYQDRVLEALFRGHFEHERDISDMRFLADVAVETGVLPSATQAALVLAGGGSELARQVEAEERHARDIGVSAVPSYVVQGRYRVGGSQEPGVFLSLFEKIAAAGDAGAEGGPVHES